MRNQPAIREHLAQERGQRLAWQNATAGFVCDRAKRKIDPHLVALVDRGGFRTDHDGKAKIKRIAIENAAEGFRNDRRDTQHLQRLRRLLARRTHAEIAARDYDVPRPHIPRESWRDGLKAMLR